MTMTAGQQIRRPGSGAIELWHRPPIDLQKLTEWTPLDTRIDRKYVASGERIEQVLASVADRFVVLEIDDARTFEYRSLYFDTPDFASYRAAATQRRSRFKVRVRCYVGTNQTALEVKTRSGRGETVKVRTDHTSDVAVLDHAACRFVDDSIGMPGLGAVLVPTMWTRYRRSTFVDTDDGSKITIDRALSASTDGCAWRSLTDHVVVETKATRNATAMDRELWRAHTRPVAISKYAAAMAMHHPDLPANRWSRLLRNQFH